MTVGAALAGLWARLPPAVPLEVVHCPERDLCHRFRG
jgi:hypothetical protein